MRRHLAAFTLLGLVAVAIPPGCRGQEKVELPKPRDPKPGPAAPGPQEEVRLAAVKAWAGFGEGSVFEIAEETRDSTEDPLDKKAPAGKAPAETTRAATEVWTIVKKDEKSVTLEISRKEAGALDARTRKTTISLLPPPAPAKPERQEPSQGDESMRLPAEKVTTPAGTFECDHVETRHWMLDAGGTEETWTTTALPLPVRSIVRFSQKRSTTVTTRTLTRVEKK